MVTGNAWNSRDPAEVARGGLGSASHTPYAVICAGTTSTSPFQSVASVGSANEVLTSNGAGNLPSFQPLADSVLVQTVSTSSTTQVLSAALMPRDNTIPQQSEGVEYITLAITPTSASNRLLIQFISYGGNSGETTALFQDSTADALAVNQIQAGGEISAIVLVHEMAAGTTSSTTFKIRFGQSAAGNALMNRNVTGATFGGVSIANFTIEEYSV